MQFMIGVYDSGIGGLSVWKELAQVMPKERYFYVSDAGYCPYGPKPKEEILERAKAVTEYLISNGAEIVVVACNTATAAAIEYLRGHYPIPFVGMEPAVKPAAINTKTGAIGVLATKGTFKGELYLRTLHKFASNAKVIEQVGEGLVELVESGDTKSEKARELVGRYVIPMIEQGADHIVLGCTHYPFLEDTIREFTSNKVTIVNPAPAVAKRAAEVLSGRRNVLKERGIACNGKGSQLEGTFVTTGDNLEILKKTVSGIAPENFERFEFEKTEIPYGKL